ncbi:glyoxalase/bleomycin resistance/extradiol dioxygenase family protein [Rouxiella sp. S1S-2]|uniref:VOC family protein n=1 Tax=Rouxiella sp. S1S-2 TaxID=2653856 RepID=UPI001264300E|nr:VOC family protein [Rouxiella sp. S1S-2]KAB7895962.1 glyoxalase/bleomycin resistance/extradiol dioxygenase family protein [Rouxiella sp. S1S-2]
MKIAHIALWTSSLETQARFWVNFFDAEINEKYSSQTNLGFESYFVKIADDIAVELMTKPGLTEWLPDNSTCGWAHLAISVGGKDKVDALARKAEALAILVSRPRTTGDGYYEAVIKDPDGNLIEIVE